MQQFEEIHQYLPNVLGLGGMMASLMIAFIIFTDLHFSDKKVKVWIQVAPLVTGAILAIIAIVYFFNSSIANEQAFENNVKQKYAVDEVYLEFRDNHTDPIKTEVQSVYVLKDDAVYEFYVTQDKTTWEPTLVPAPSEEKIIKQWTDAEAPKR